MALTAQQLDHAIQPVLRKLEDIGVKLDVGHLATLETNLQDELTEIEAEVVELAGRPVKLGSPKDLSSLLFEELTLQDGTDIKLHRRKTGYSTAAHELEKLRDRHPIVPQILRYREVGKLLSTYVLPLPKLVDPAGRLHTHYRIDTASGRLSSSQPNLQNIPTRTDLGREIRRAFIADTGQMLVAFDYSQLQLRIIAHLADDTQMKQVFADGGDIHEATATTLGIDRRSAKAVNFGILYGLSAYGLAEALAISREEAQSIIDEFLKAYPRVAMYIQELIHRAHATGYAETMSGKRRALPHLASSNDYLKKAAERIAINHPIQGAEAEIVKAAMIDIDRASRNVSTWRMILQVHDELVFEIQETALEATIPKLMDMMERSTKLSVPLVVAAKAGQTWADLEKV